MPDPADLPPEIFAAVLDFALDNASTKQLCELSLLSRGWHAALVRRIYSTWTYNGSRQPFTTLVKFLRTVLSNHDLASLVRELRVGNWGYYPSGRLGKGLDLPPDERELLRQAAEDAGIGDYFEPDITMSLDKLDRRPLVALLLTCLPNLITAYAHVPEPGPVLAAVLKQIVNWENSGGGLYPLRGLQEIHLYPEPPAPEPPTIEPILELGSEEEEAEPDWDSGDLDSSQELLPDYIWPIFYLPGLRSLSLVDLNTETVAALLNSASLRKLESLCLICHEASSCRAADVQALVTQPEHLKSFSFCFQPYDVTNAVSNIEVCQALQQRHKHSLERLDFYRPCFVIDRKENVHFGPLREFTRLKHLSLPEEALFAGCYHPHGAAFHLKDMLPPNLESLTIYAGAWLKRIRDFLIQLQEVVHSPGEFPFLESIILETRGGFQVIKPGLQTQYKALEQACQSRNIGFCIENGYNLSKGGTQQENWPLPIGVEDIRDVRGNPFSRPMASQNFMLEPLLPDYVFADEVDDDSEDEWGPYGNDPWKVHTTPFLDHLGNTAYMVFMNEESFPLPPLFSFAIYFTHTDLNLDTEDMAVLYDEVVLLFMFPNHVRLDMYFLPGASHEDCMSHYQRERAARGSWKVQRNAFLESRRDEVHPLPGSPGQLPGMVINYREASPYRGVLFVCEEKEWREGQRTLSHLQFDKGMEADHQHTYPVFTVTSLPMNDRSPAWVEDQHTVGSVLYDLAKRKKEKHREPWQKATSRGWTAW